MDQPQDQRKEPLWWLPLLGALIGALIAGGLIIMLMISA